MPARKGSCELSERLCFSENDENDHQQILSLNYSTSQVELKNLRILEMNESLFSTEPKGMLDDRWTVGDRKGFTASTSINLSVGSQPCLVKYVAATVI